MKEAKFSNKNMNQNQPVIDYILMDKYNLRNQYFLKFYIFTSKY